jgi:Flp pilus assembly protein TadG
MTRLIRNRPSAVASAKEERGATLVEAAIMTPILLLLTFSIVDFAGLFYVYLAIENGASQATRYAVTGQVITGQTREDSIKAAMRQATPTLTIQDNQFSFSHMKPGTSVWVSGAGGEGDIGKLTITYPWRLMTPVIRPFFTNGELVIRVESAMKNERRFTSE